MFDNYTLFSDPSAWIWIQGLQQFSVTTALKRFTLDHPATFHISVFEVVSISLQITHWKEYQCLSLTLSSTVRRMNPLYLEHGVFLYGVKNVDKMFVLLRKVVLKYQALVNMIIYWMTGEIECENINMKIFCLYMNQIKTAKSDKSYCISL